MKFKKIQTLLYGMPLLLVAMTSNGVSTSNNNLTNVSNNPTKETALAANTYNEMIPSFEATLSSNPNISVHNKLRYIFDGDQLKQNTMWNSWFWDNNEAWSQFENKNMVEHDNYWLHGNRIDTGYVTTMKLYTGKKQEVFIVVTPAPSATWENGYIDANENRYIISVAVFNEGGVDAPFLRAPIWKCSKNVYISGDKYGFTFEDQGTYTDLSFANSDQPNTKLWDMNIQKTN